MIKHVRGGAATCLPHPEVPPKAASKGGPEACMVAPMPRKAATGKRPARRPSATRPAGRRGGLRPKLLSGGNPQIAKGAGEAPVKACIAAMPGWKRKVGEALDRLIGRTVPGVAKAVKWNSPFYGVEQGTWFMSFHCFDRYVKVAFFRGAQLMPLPPGPSKQKDVRYLDIHESEWINEVQLAEWVKQASLLPGERM